MSFREKAEVSHDICSFCYFKLYGKELPDLYFSGST